MSQIEFGAGVLWGTPLLNPDGSTPTNPTPTKFGIIQEVSLNVEFQTKELYGGNQFPAAIGRGQGKITATAKSAQIIGSQWAQLFFGKPFLSGMTADYNDNAGQAIPAGYTGTTPTAPTGTPSGTGGTIPAGTTFAKIVAIDAGGNMSAAGTESASVTTTGTTSSIAWAWTAVAGAASYRIYTGAAAGAENTYFTSATNSFTQTAPTGTAGTPPTSATTGGVITVAPPNSGTFQNDLGVINAAGNPMTKITSGTPATGQYSVNATTGAYTFATADYGNTVFINYQYSLTSVQAPNSGNFIVTSDLMGYSPVFAVDLMVPYYGKQLVMHLYQVTSSKLSLPLKMDDFLIPQFDMQAFADTQNRVAAFSFTGG